MTTDERVQAVVDYGFTSRQAGFLLLVMRHSGLCVKRQYAGYARVANGGEKCNSFFAKLLRRGFASETPCIHSRARLYHVHHKALYHAIGDSGSRYRRPVPARAAGERLMRLDAALISPDLDWVTTRIEKVAYLRSIAAPDSGARHPDASVGTGAHVASGFPGTFPIGIDQTGRTVLLYVATKPWTDDFRTFLAGHTGLLAQASTWTLRMVFPQPLRRAVPDYQAVVDEELEPLAADAVRELQHYFFHRRRRTALTELPETLRGILARYSTAYSGPRFAHLYRRWLTDEQRALTPVSTTIQAAVATRRAAIDYVVLPHVYEHLFPLVNRERLHDPQTQGDDEEGDDAPHGVNPFLNPVP